MGARYEIGELEYASGYEKMYGVTDEQLAFLSRYQDNFRRFEVEPTYDAALEPDFERLATRKICAFAWILRDRTGFSGLKRCQREER